ncbi:UNVERIFIED_CONTAM: hypothetical protein PYX00_003681 [Menopon gallinae]|uniref:Activator of Hsp90 ATPase AHSA1-like N-terminal domain-containing protein n=1 Tax=Menopon gallinae TaxID=328185 RepID=A0AAW2I1K4_9NEOP
MAKWGEGDPRWIVEERPDAINVNNWHWTEKNACGWSKDRFNDLFTGFKIENDLFKCKITEVEKCSGEAVANNRKGKLIFFYEWEITLKWKAKLNSANSFVNGKIVIPNLSEENEVHEVDVNISTNESSVEGDALREVMKELTTEKVREQLGKYIQGLKAGMILPSKGSNEDTECKDSINNISTGLESKVKVNSNAINAVKSAPNIKSPGQKINTTNIELSQVLQCTAVELYNSLTVTEMVAAFTHGRVKLDAKPGGKFELFEGNVSGEFIQLEPYSKIVQSWRCERWPSGHYSIVTIDIKQQAEFTEFKLTQTGVPQGESESIRENWERYYLDALKSTFGFGYFI